MTARYTINLVCALVPYKNKFALGYSDTNSLVINNKEDLKHFKSITCKKDNINIVIMGRKTWESINCKLLKDRINIILTNNKELYNTDKAKYTDIEISTNEPNFMDKNTLYRALIQMLERPLYRQTLFNISVIGGNDIYKLFSYNNSYYTYDKMYITLYKEHNFTKLPDVFFDTSVINNNYILTKFSDTLKYKPSDTEYRYLEYRYLEYTNTIDNKVDKESISYGDIKHFDMNHISDNYETKYLRLVENVIKNGITKIDRTETGTISLFGESLKIDISKNVPLLTSKFMNWKNIIEELLWFLRGDTDVTLLNKKGIKIWDGNTTREFLDKNNLQHIQEKTIGASYSWQWRNFGAEYDSKYKDTSKLKCDEGFDQINYILKTLKTDPASRRMVLTGWNPMMLKDMALPPCHLMAIFNVQGNCLNCHLTMRSTDVGLGLPYNMFSYTVLVYILAKKANLVPGELYYTGTDVHVYNNHLTILQKQCDDNRNTYKSGYIVKTQPTMLLNDSIINKDFSEITVEDFEMLDYYSGKYLKMDMAI